jgi:4-amino-4-deoxy-L-arabinose transferase-like glycosyltransferase
VTLRRALALVGAAAVLPRLAVLLAERGDILAEFTEKSDDFARTFVDSGTFGFIPGEPSAWTQPLYGFVLVPLYWVFGRNWPAVGLAQIALAAITALLVYEIGRRFVSPRAGLVAALVATLNPYLVWHDVHVNREIVDGLLAAAVVLLVLLAAERRSLWLAVAAGAVAGLAVLSNARLVGVPLVLAAFVFWRARSPLAAGALVAAAVLVAVPWVVRNRVEVGCATLTTDSRALWKANNQQAYEILDRGGWIDDVPRIPGSPYTPEEAGALYLQTGRVVHADECEQMRYYRGLVTDFWREHPGEKARLALQSTRLLWDPRVRGREGSGGARESLRTWSALYFAPLFLVGAIGLALVRRDLAVLALALLAYGTLAAMVFVGTTRYRVSWDFLLAVPAGAVLARGWERFRA